MEQRGRGMGGGGGGRGQSGGGKGMGGGQGKGPGGKCVCPNCGETVPHDRGVPCFEMRCPRCGAGLVRR